ncbi:hypothetical protein EYF80_043404 [Liparis tanakae]|uniref:Uncharacterized protein n=1 Tax=Liparis tanakae TaxID=230148 RepID=A0A4Z2FZY2_9TELE|nr:hypothetical protein EYF80_043404 [Liparis tanakae]
MPTLSADEMEQGLNPEGLNRSHRNTRVLEEFAQSMSEGLIQSFKSQMETLGAEVEFLAFEFNQNQEELVEELASAVMEVAPREGASGSYAEGSAGGKTDGGAPEDRPFVDESDIERSPEVNPGKGDPQARHRYPPHPGLPAGGSIDYPDAPPPTPLLPELRRSRRGFSRKLKGGLAAAYPPSNPPPSPKDEEGGAASRPQLTEHPMHSLVPQWTISNGVDSVRRGRNGERVAADSHLHLLALRLAGSIITSSLDEAQALGDLTSQ